MFYISNRSFTQFGRHLRFWRPNGALLTLCGNHGVLWESCNLIRQQAYMHMLVEQSQKVRKQNLTALKFITRILVAHFLQIYYETTLKCAKCKTYQSLSISDRKLCLSVFENKLLPGKNVFQ